MVDDQPAANGRFAGQINPTEDLDSRFQKTVGEGEGFAQDGRSHAITPAAKPVNKQYPDAWPPGISIMRIEVFADPIKHRQVLRSPGPRGGHTTAERVRPGLRQQGPMVSRLDRLLSLTSQLRAPSTQAVPGTFEAID